MGQNRGVLEERNQSRQSGMGEEFGGRGVGAVEYVNKGSSTETVAFQVYEILKINHKFLQFF